MRISTILAAATWGLAATVTAAPAQDIAERLAAADPAAGERLFRQCVACHTIEEGGANRVGPNLYGIVGRPVASAEGFRYSPAMTAHGGEWTPELLDVYLTDPRAEVKGTRMAFRGIPDPADRADVIAYLNTFSAEPMDFGAGGAAGDEESGPEQSAEADSGAEQDFGQLVVAEGAEETYYACTACHSEMIIAQQGKTREGWDKMLDWMVAEQGMAELPEQERNIILDYLAAHYNTDRPNFPRP